MGWGTVHMGRLYTDVITREDRRTADHIGVLLDPTATDGNAPKGSLP